MPQYYLNNNEQTTGEHEIHEVGCFWLSITKKQN